MYILALVTVVCILALVTVVCTIHMQLAHMYYVLGDTQAMTGTHCCHQDSR